MNTPNCRLEAGEIAERIQMMVDEINKRLLNGAICDANFVLALDPPRWLFITLYRANGYPMQCAAQLPFGYITNKKKCMTFVRHYSKAVNAALDNPENPNWKDVE